MVYNDSVGIFWLIKDAVFPDPAFQQKATIFSIGISWLTVLGPYLVPAYKLASNEVSNDISIDRFVICALMYIFGVVFMLLSDSQKFYTLKYKYALDILRLLTGKD